MPLELLESRVLFAAAPIDASSVALFDPQGNPASINPRRNLWLIIHGGASSKDDEDIQRLAQAVDASSTADQVLLVDWSQLAVAPDNTTAVHNAWAAGDAVAKMIRTTGLQAYRVNLIGFSFGGQVEDEIARDLTRYGGVNRIIALDPSAPVIKFGQHSARALPAYAAESQYSIAFYENPIGNYVAAALPADDAVFLTGLPGDSILTHVEVPELFTTMIRRDTGLEAGDGEPVSALFSIDNILNGTLPPWRRNAFAAGNEATMNCQRIAASTNPVEFEPLTLTYVNRRGHVIRVG